MHKEPQISKNILVIENDHDTRVFLRSVFESDGHFVISSPDVAGAIQLLESISSPNLVLLSTSLPSMDSHDFIKLFRSVSKYDDVPIAQLGFSTEERMIGTFRFLKKPLNKEDLLQVARAESGENEL